VKLTNPSYSTEVKKGGAIIPLSLMSSLIKRRDNFIFFLIYFKVKKAIPVTSLGGL
jgi:hypothetical protein